MAHKHLSTIIWETLLLDSAAPPNRPTAARPSVTQSHSILSPIAGEKRGLAVTVETQRIRLLVHSASGAPTGVRFSMNFWNFKLSKSWSNPPPRSMKQCVSSLLCLESKPLTPTSPHKILELIPAVPEEPTDAATCLACDPGHTFKMTFAEQVEAAAKRLKENFPGSLCPALTLVNQPVAATAPPR